jgi:hypothetical protein
MGEAYARCPECEKTKDIRWCDNCGCRLKYVAIDEGHGFGHYLDGHRFHFCSDECHDEWHAIKRPKKPENWDGSANARATGGVTLECRGCQFKINSIDFVKLRPEDYTSEALDMGGCPRCGHYMIVVL